MSDTYDEDGYMEEGEEELYDDEDAMSEDEAGE